MAVIVNKDEEKDALSRRINADLREKTQAARNENATTDFTDDTDYMKDMKATGKFAWVWIVTIIVVVVLGIVIYNNIHG